MTDLHLHKTALKYGLILAALLMHFKTIEYIFFSYKVSLDLYLGIVAFSFLLIGAWMGLHFHAKQQLITNMMPDVQPQVETSPNEDLLSVREKEVLKTIGKVEIDHGETSCKTFIIEEYLNKIYEREAKKS